MYKDWSVRNEKVAMSHKKYRQTFLMSLIGDFGTPETSRRTEVAADTEQRLNTPFTLFIYNLGGGSTRVMLCVPTEKIKGGEKKHTIFAKHVRQNLRFILGFVSKK